MSELWVNKSKQKKEGENKKGGSENTRGMLGLCIPPMNCDTNFCIVYVQNRDNSLFTIVSVQNRDNPSNKELHIKYQ